MSKKYDPKKTVTFSLGEIILAEGSDKKKVAPEEIQIYRVGKFDHPWYGPFNLTQDDFLEMKSNFDNRIRRCDLAVDYSHDSDGKAAGWITDIILKENNTQLWASIKWTESGRASVESGEFRYISGEFHPQYQDAETGVTHGKVIFGAALTNRPFIKDMAATTELKENMNREEENREMTPEELKKFEEATNKLSEATKQLGKTSEEVTRLSDENKKLKAEIATAEIEKAKTEKNAKFDVMLSEGKVCEAQREPFMVDDMAKFAELAQPLNLAEAGSKKPKKDSLTGEAAVDKVLELAEVKSKDLGIDFRIAVSKVLSENPELRKEYEEISA